jgi:hypothetical protein
LRENGADIALVNTTVSGLIIPALKQAGFTVVSMIHELPGILETYALQKPAHAITDHADIVVFAEKSVQDGFESFVGKKIKRTRIRPQGLYLRTTIRSDTEREAARSAVRQELEIPANARIILAVGYADLRKGADLFVEAMITLIEREESAYGVWVGHVEKNLIHKLHSRISEAGLTHRFRFTGLKNEPQRYYAAADVYALTSREDPFPSTALEALDATIPVVAFQGTTGCEEIIKRGTGLIVPALDIKAFADGLSAILNNPALANCYGSQGRAIIEHEFNFRHYLFDLLKFAGKTLPRISVIVPNYNYASYLQQRLDSIAQQTVPIFEIIILDDASTDNSKDVIENFRERCDIPSRLVINDENSGSVFQQWLRGAELARGDLIWIAEADDLADPDFLKHVTPTLNTPGTVMSYCQSRQIAEDGTVLSDDYLDYVTDVDPEKWTEEYHVDGNKEITNALFLKNTIPNVSGVLFRRSALLEALRENRNEICSYRNTGDWVTYLRVLEKGSIAFCPLPLNSHRRHQKSVTLGNSNLRHLQEVVAVQADTIRRFKLGALAEMRAAAYAQQLYEQFNLVSSEYPTLGTNPEITGTS